MRPAFSGTPLFVPSHFKGALMRSIHIIIYSSLLILSGPDTVSALMSSSTAFPSSQDQLVRKASERQRHERLGDENAISGHYENALDHYTEAALLSIEELHITGTMQKAYCALLTFRSTRIGEKLNECDKVDGKTVCWKSEAIEILQCAGSEELCQKVSRAWRPVIKTRNITIAKERPCAPYDGSF